MKSASLLGLLLFLAACGGDDDASSDGDAAVDAGTDAEGPRWPGGAVSVRVVDEEGAPIEGASVLTGGSLDAVLSDADGRATIQVDDDGVTDRWALAGKRGWRNAGQDLDDHAPPPELVTIELERLPSEDNVEYRFGEVGDGNAPNTLYCGHCHRSIADQWVGSKHRGALSNPRTRDLWNGSVLSVASEDACVAFGGFWAEGRAAGQEAGAEARCYVGRGVLPDLNPACGGVGEPACDARDLPPGTLQNHGQCGNCHGAAIPAAVPNRVDLNDATGYTFTEGVTCDLCHKVAEVTVGPRGGLDGAIRLLRPSEVDPSPLHPLRPIMFGPWPDVINPFMGATVQPQFRSGELCSACHEYAMVPLAPADEPLLDRERFPDGVPVHSTWSEWSASFYERSTPCPACHMPSYDEDTAIGNLSDLGTPGIAAGWLREHGELRAHSFVSADVLARDNVDLQVVLTNDPSGQVRATVTLANVGAGHALPTGEPLRQVGVFVSATMDGVPVPVSGDAIADVGGALAQGTIGADATLLGTSLTLAGEALDDRGITDVRFVRPTGAWVDYEGPGAGWFAAPERTPEERGLAELDALEEIPVTATSGDTVTLATAPADAQPGDLVFLVGDHDWAGAPGALYGKVLVDRNGQRGVHHYQAITIASDHRIAADSQASTIHLVPAPLPGQELVVTARALYRRAAANIARTYAWPIDDLPLALSTARRP